MNQRRIRTWLACAAVLSLLVACGQSQATSVEDSSAESSISTSAADSPTTTDSTAVQTVADIIAANGETHAADAAQTAETGSVTIALNGDTISVDGAGTTVDGSRVTITAAGRYTINGSLIDGQVAVDTEDAETVYLVLNGVEINNSTSAPINIINAAEAVIELADGTDNVLTDGSAYIYDSPEDDEPNATLFSDDNLTITGTGSLTVNANYNDAIASKDGLVISGGTITVNSVDDGIRGKDYLVITGGTITADVAGDGLKSDEDEDATLGYIAIEAGTFVINAGGDAIQAETDVLISGGDFAITAGGGSGALLAEDQSAKGIKGAVTVVIDGGTFSIDAADDAIHSNESIVINGGLLEIATGDDGVHADATIEINGGDIRIAESYEGIESSVITINAGTINVVSSDDGLNVAGGNDGSGGGGPGGMRGGGQRGQDNFTYEGDYYLYINGGTIIVDANGDGLDANGAIEMSGGLVLVNGPTGRGNGALDYDGTFNISGGVLVAAGSAGMAQGPGAASTQPSALLSFGGAVAAGTLVHIAGSDGSGILTFAPSKEFQSVAVSSPELVRGVTYTLYTGGSATVTATPGLYEADSYTGGTEVGTFTVS